jgi:hypothetical protein
MTHSSHRADEPVSLPTNGDTCVCKFRDAIVCILSDGQQAAGSGPDNERVGVVRVRSSLPC